ncbi:hypothetical protein MK079_03145 [Candidatus Gracilibacteria bacterium]|nr:hypothetical protein [Candidatus Gracilibacteria bacterium]
MNTQLESLFVQYHVSEKNQHDIRQIFSLLPSEKQQNILRNFPWLAERMNQIEENLRQEQEILLGDMQSIADKMLQSKMRKQIVLDQ